MRRNGVLFAMSILAAALSFSRLAVGQAAAQSLVFTERVWLLNCEPASSHPCFRLKFKIVDAQGGSSSVALPSQSNLVQNLTVHVDDSTVNPFFAVASTETQGQTKSRIALILVDISGSMNKPVPTGESRFEAAKAALSYYLEGFEDGIDRVAIVPFESHGVAATIRSAQFATKRSEAQRQVALLPAPNKRNNTALYSAVDEALERLQGQRSGAQDAEVLLFVLTDGENDVENGDDPGLLTGSEGLEKVTSKVRACSGIRVTAVGIGDPREVNQDDLKQIANRFKMVTDTEGLRREFKHPAATPLSSSMQATFSSPWPDRASLAARTLHLRVSLQLPAGEKLESNETTWSTPEMGLPLFEGKCDEREGDALIRSAAVQASAAGWTSVLRPVLVFAGLGSVLLILWFWVPRLAWADRYVGSFQPQAQARWASGPSGPRPTGTPGGKPAPPGFEQGKAGIRVPQRAPGDQTTVLPVNMMGTRTRLELKLPPEKERGK